MLASTVFLHCRTVGCELPEGVLRCGYNYHAMLEGLQVRNALHPAQSWEIYNLIFNFTAEFSRWICRCSHPYVHKIFSNAEKCT